MKTLLLSFALSISSFSMASSQTAGGGASELDVIELRAKWCVEDIDKTLKKSPAMRSYSDPAPEGLPIVEKLAICESISEMIQQLDAVNLLNNQISRLERLLTNPKVFSLYDPSTAERPELSIGERLQQQLETIKGERQKSTSPERLLEMITALAERVELI